MALTRTLAPILAVALALVPLASSAAAKPDKARVDKAVEKGAAWVKARQGADGAWHDRWNKDSAYPVGETAIALLALLKCGVAPSDPAINKGFDWLLEQPLKKCYEVSISILALEARYAPKLEQPDPEHPYRTVARKDFMKHAGGREKDWLARAASFLVSNQKAQGMWAYPMPDADVSNTQFALLALKSAHRLGINVPKEVWLGSLSYFVAQQEKSGNKIAQFEVPAADGPIDDVEDRKAAAAARAKDPNAHSKTASGCECRGWGYKPGQGPRGSMTAAGVACLVVIKSELEGNPSYEKKLSGDVDRSIRDGCAWLADRFKVAENPGAGNDWLFYYLYTLERAGTLTGCELLGTHRWYDEGADLILSAQRDDGHFDEPSKQEYNDATLAGSCLALLFLKRATVPVIERTATGPGSESLGGGGASPAAGGASPAAHIEKLEDGQFAVTFRVKLPGNPGRVTVAGSFNNWDKDANPLAPAGGDVFEATVRMKGGKITYKFVLNGSDWRQDPGNPATEDDGSGNKNSVLDVH